MPYAGRRGIKIYMVSQRLRQPLFRMLSNVSSLENIVGLQLNSWIMLSCWLNV